MNRKPIVTGQIYHIFNRGVDKRDIFMDKEDINRFFFDMKVFNEIEPVYSIFLRNLKLKRGEFRGSTSKLVEFVAYCLNPNHFHFIIRPLVDGGLAEFMKRLGGGYTLYFNERYKRSGSLFQGRFKSVHIESDSQLRHTSVYVNLNNKVHRIGDEELTMSSWEEYSENVAEGCCDTEDVLQHFKTKKEYIKFAKETLVDIIKRKEDIKGIDVVGIKGE